MKGDFPECSYIVFDSANIDGVTNIEFREEEGGFLAGALAALMTTATDVDRINDDTVIGIILGEKVPPAKAFPLSAIRPVRGTPRLRSEVLCEYTGSFVDASRVEGCGGEAARTGGGRDILRRGGPASMAAIKNAPSGGYWCIGCGQRA